MNYLFLGPGIWSNESVLVTKGSFREQTQSKLQTISDFFKLYFQVSGLFKIFLNIFCFEIFGQIKKYLLKVLQKNFDCVPS